MEFGFYQIFGILVFIFGLLVLFFNNFWQNHLYGYRSMAKIQDKGPITKKINAIIFGIVMMVSGIISFFKIGF